MNRKHALLMVLCCLIPLAAFAAISIFRMPVNTVIYAAIALACPAMHLLMMRGMRITIMMKNTLITKAKPLRPWIVRDTPDKIH